MRYKVNDLYHCIQGEGVMAGTPMVLLRLHGCAVGCPFCDTKETWAIDSAQRVNSLDDALGPTSRWCEMSASEINYEIAQRHSGALWVLVTGGEPADQHLGALTCALRDGGHRVALETSGTALGHVGAGFDWVCVSPKIDMPGGRQILPESLASADEIKHVVGKESDIAKLDSMLAELGAGVSAQICLQPISQSKRATALCKTTCKERNWRLSIQIHKYIDER